MKTAFCFLTLLLIIVNGKAQSYSGYDSTKKHELSLSLLPVLIPMAGSTQSQYTNFQFGYRYYRTNGTVYRSSLSWYPFINQISSYPSPVYDRTVGDKIVFKQYVAGGGGKAQVNLGIEKIFSSKILQQGFGVDLFINHMYRNRGEDYYHRPDTASVYIRPGDTTNYIVDTLGYYNNERLRGIGFHLFYTLRLKLSSRWYFSATMGPTFSFINVRGTYYDRRLGSETKRSTSTFDYFALPFISEFSLCFRF